jgi:general secretion pathway protein K
MIAAVAAVAGFGYLALAAIGGGRSAVTAASAELDRARLTAAADAATAMAIDGLGASDPGRRWRLVGPPHALTFQGARLTVTVDDENGKIPINFIRPDQMRRLFEQAGADPRQIDGLVETLQELRGDPKPNGFSGVGARLAAERGLLSDARELELLPGMTPALYARIAPAVTVYANTLAFDPRTASPLALAVMSPSYSDTPAAIEQARLDSGRTPAFEAVSPISLDGRTLSVQVDASDERGGWLRRTTVVQFTGAPQRPYVVRGVQ